MPLLPHQPGLEHVLEELLAVELVSGEEAVGVFEGLSQVLKLVFQFALLLGELLPDRTERLVPDLLGLGLGDGIRIDISLKVRGKKV